MDKIKEAIKVSIPYIINYLIMISIFSFFVYLYKLKLILIIDFIQITWPFLLLIICIIEYRYFYIKNKIQRHDYNQSCAFMLDKIYLNELQNLSKKINEERNKELINKKQWENYIQLWSHEIKTPLTRIKLMLENYKTDLNQKLCQQVIIIQNQLNLLLTYERFKNFNGDLHFKNVNLYEECNSCLKSLMEIAISKNLTVNNNIKNITYLTDEKWLKVVIEQILLNSIKYSNKNGKITIEIKNSTLKIIDNGIGISSEDLPEIFKLGYIGKNARQCENSSGIGLYLVKQICQKLNIDINVQSSINNGTTVNLCLNPKLIKNNKL